MFGRGHISGAPIASLWVYVPAGPPSLSRVYTIDAEDRRFSPSGNDMRYTVAAEDRMFTVAAEDRAFTVPDEDHTLTEGL